jgi:hypothetical protein
VCCAKYKRHKEKHEVMVSVSKEKVTDVKAEKLQQQAPHMFIIHSRNPALNHDIKRANKPLNNVATFRHLGRRRGDGSNKLKLHSPEIRTN